jgi:ankyrin repeat protein
MRFDMRGTPLIVACQSQHDVDCLRTLLEAGADPNMEPDTSIYPIALVASLAGYTDVAAIDVMLQHGARPEGTGSLAYTAMKGKEAIVLSLLKAGARPEAEPNAAPGGYHATPSPLHAAVIHGHESVVRLLLDYGADRHATDNKGLTATDHAKQMAVDGKDVSRML